MLNITSQFSIDGRFVGGDKSISHRALMLAAASRGVCVVRNLSLCDDVMSTIKCLRALGADIKIDHGDAIVCPIVVCKKDVVLDCGNSGTTARLLAGLVSGFGVRATFVGDKSLMSRPMERVLKPLEAMGAKFGKKDGALFTTEECDLVGCRLRAEVDSAQVKSAVLLAAMFADGETTYREPVPTRDHTERMMKYVGVNIDGTTVSCGTPHSFDVSIPNDFSSAAYLIATALLTKQSVTVENVGVNPGRLGLFNVLLRSGAKISLLNKREVCGEPVADICVEPSTLSPLYASKLDVCDGIDEVPLMAAVAIATKGKSVFCDVGELTKKESDRIAAVIEMAAACGQKATFEDGNLVVTSDGKLPLRPWFATSHDHRIVMCQTTLCLACGGGSVDDYACVSVSFPSFWRSLGITFSRYAVIGENIGYSRSPQIMRKLASQNDVCMSYDIVNLPRDVSDKVLLNVIDGYDGCNVTIPFKGRVAALFGSSLPSVNTVACGQAISTDGVGLVRALDKHGFVYENQPLWVVGAGGAAEACIAELVKHGAKIQVFNRTCEHADNLTEKYGLCHDVDNPTGVLSFVPPCEFEATINLPQSVKFVFAASYGHEKESPLLTKAKQQNIACADGTDMLYCQAEASFDFWNDIKKGIRI